MSRESADEELDKLNKQLDQYEEDEKKSSSSQSENKDSNNVL